MKKSNLKNRTKASEFYGGKSELVVPSKSDPGFQIPSVAVEEVVTKGWKNAESVEKFINTRFDAEIILVSDSIPWVR